MRFALLRYVPTRFRTLERCLEFVRQNPDNLLYVPEVHYENAEFAYWTKLYWPSVKHVFDLSNPPLGNPIRGHWRNSIMGVDFIGSGDAIRESMGLLQLPWRDAAVCLAYVKTSQKISELQPEDLTDDIFLTLVGRGLAAGFINQHNCDLVYSFILRNRHIQKVSMLKELSIQSVRWLEEKGYFDVMVDDVNHLSSEQISDTMIIKVLSRINYVQAENVLKHSGFLRLYLAHHGVEPSDHGRAAVQLMYHLLSHYGAYSRPIQSLLMAHSDAIYEMAPIEFTEFVLDGLMSLRNIKNHKGLRFHQMVIKNLSEQLRYCEEFGFDKYISMLQMGSLNNIQALHKWGDWYFKIHHLDEIVAWCDSQDTWKLAIRYASRETLMQHPHGRRLLLEQDLEL